jgi:hypothetical protein
LDKDSGKASYRISMVVSLSNAMSFVVLKVLEVSQKPYKYLILELSQTEKFLQLGITNTYT